MRFTMKLLLLLASLLFLVNATTVSPPGSTALVGDDESAVGTGISPNDPSTPSSTISPFNARDDDGTAFTAAKKRCAICNAFVSDCVRNGHKSFEYCRDEQCKAKLYFCGGCKYMPCRQPKLNARDNLFDNSPHNSKFRWTQWRPIGLPYGNTERSALPPSIENDKEVKASGDSKGTWDQHHVIGLPLARNLPTTEHDIDLSSPRDMPMESEDDVFERRRCMRECRFVLDGGKKIKDNNEMRKSMKKDCKGCGTCRGCFGHNWN